VLILPYNQCTWPNANITNEVVIRGLAGGTLLKQFNSNGTELPFPSKLACKVDRGAVALSLSICPVREVSGLVPSGCLIISGRPSHGCRARLALIPPGRKANSNLALPCSCASGEAHPSHVGSVDLSPT